MACLWLLVGAPLDLTAQSVSHRGFVEGTVYLFPQAATEDRTRAVVDLLARGEVLAKPRPWMQLAGSLELRANSHDQVMGGWRVDVSDRTARRPWLSLRTLSVTVTHGRVTIDAGKQFIRWGKTDIIVPTDRFAPRDFMNLIDAPYLAVPGVRGTVQAGARSIEAVWVPRFTPSRLPLLHQRWAAAPSGYGLALPIVETQPVFPEGAQYGIRLGHVASRADYSICFYDGFTHLPAIRSRVIEVPDAAIEVARVYAPIRMYGGDSAVPLRWVTFKGEAGYFTSSSTAADEYMLYVLQLERQQGEWWFVAGYAGETVVRRRNEISFAPDRGLSRSILARASYVIDTNRRVDFEGAVRQNGGGVYGKAEFSQARGDHWRATFAVVVIAGRPGDFVGQYAANSHVRLALRYSY